MPFNLPIPLHVDNGGFICQNMYKGATQSWMYISVDMGRAMYSIAALHPIF